MMGIGSEERLRLRRSAVVGRRGRGRCGLALGGGGAGVGVVQRRSERRSLDADGVTLVEQPREQRIDEGLVAQELMPLIRILLAK